MVSPRTASLSRALCTSYRFAAIRNFRLISQAMARVNGYVRRNCKDTGSEGPPTLLPRSAAAFSRAHAPFELGEISRERKVLVVAALFGPIEPADNPCKKERKHNNLQ